MLLCVFCASVIDIMFVFVFFRFFIRSCRRSSTSYFPLRSLPVFICFSIVLVIVSVHSLFLNVIGLIFMCFVSSVSISLVLHSWHDTFSSNLYFISCLIAVVQPSLPVNLSNNSFYRQWYTLRSGSLLVLSLWNSKFFRMSRCMQSLSLCFYRLLVVSCVVSKRCNTT